LTFSRLVSKLKTITLIDLGLDEWGSDILEFDPETMVGYGPGNPPPDGTVTITYLPPGTNEADMDEEKDATHQ